MSVATRRVTASTEVDANMAADALPVQQGDIVADKFRIERIVGEGGMGVVAEATHLDLDERVALKFLRQSASKNPEFLSRFTREARALVKLKSEHVARVMDVGSHMSGPFIVMEYLEGSDLANVLAERGPLSFVEAAEYVIQACEAVAEAHSRGIVHRDIKPENLFLVRRDDWQLVKVLDFGISKAALSGNVGDVDLSSHKTTSMMGSPYYMSPEQLRSTKSVDHRADVWSLGAVLFELVTGHTAFDPDLEFTELVAAILENPHRRAGSLAPGIPPDFEAVIDKCLEKDRDNRFASAAALAVALLPFAPRRARVPAERAVRMMRSAGLVVDHDVSLPTSDFPGPREDMRPSTVSITSLRTEAPTISGAPVRVVPVDAQAITEPPFPPPAALPIISEPAGESGRPRLILAAAALLFLGAVIFALVVLLRSPAPPSTVEVVEPGVVPPTGQAAANAATQTPAGASSPATTEATSEATIETTAKAGAPTHRGRGRPAPPREPKTSAPAEPPPPPQRPALDIRSSR